MKASVDEELFSLNGLQIIERNYLDVYPYEKWSSKEIPVYREGESFTPTEIIVSFGFAPRDARSFGLRCSHSYFPSFR